MLKKCTQLWREAEFKIEVYRIYQIRIDMTRNIFRNKKWQNTSDSDNFLQLRSRKKKKILRREKDFEVKNSKIDYFGCYDLEKIYAVVARTTSRRKKNQNICYSDHFSIIR